MSSTTCSAGSKKITSAALWLEYVARWAEVTQRLLRSDHWANLPNPYLGAAAKCLLG
jgi:hypothetical protein